MHRPGVELAISRSRIRRPNHYTIEPFCSKQTGEELEDCSKRELKTISTLIEIIGHNIPTFDYQGMDELKFEVGR